jgi:hypothetical protein
MTVLVSMDSSSRKRIIEDAYPEDTDSDQERNADEESNYTIVYPLEEDDDEDNDDNDEDKDEEEKRRIRAMKETDRQNEPMSASQLINKILGILMYLFSGLIISLISIDKEVRVEWAIISFEIYIIWIIMTGMMREFMKIIPTLKKNSAWYSVIVSGMNFVSTVGFLLVAQFTVDMIQDAWKDSNLNVMETITALIITGTSFYALLNSLDILSV